MSAPRYGSRLAALAALAIAVVGACSVPDEVPTQTRDPIFDELIGDALVEAEAGQASEDQLAVLNAARVAGEVSLEQAREAARATVACFEDAGLQGTVVETTEVGGLVLPGYTVGTYGDDMTDIDRCDYEHGFWVNQVYQLQPSSTQLQADFYDEHAEELRACLEDAGYETEPDATGAELAQRAGDVAVESAGEVDCLAVVGR